MPSPLEERPGLLIRDSHGYSETAMIIPPPLMPCLQCFDGQQTDLDLKALLVHITGELDVADIQQQLMEALSGAGFLHNEVYAELQEARHREFAESAVRLPAHAGSAYPPDEQEARHTLAGYMAGAELASEDGSLVGIAAPHVSPFGGWESYRDAYSALARSHGERTFVILGTSHYGEPNRFGLTRKPFVTPYGTAKPDLRLIEELAGEPAAQMEDYYHAVEHSIEFQVVFLQHLFGADIRIVPILCGSFMKSIYEGNLPEDDEHVRSFLGRLGDIAAREDKKLLWVLGIDMAHMGVRYGDDFEAEANRGEMQEVAERDKGRIECINSADSKGFWERVREGHDELKWCGASPAYTFLKAVPGARGTTRRYQQWNIDDRSVVSFGALAFHRT